MKKICVKCKVEKDRDEFYKKKTSQDGLQNYCKICKNLIDNRYITKPEVRERNRKGNIIKNKNQTLKIREIQLSKGGKCKKCGENRLHLLDFHHVDPKEKVNLISNIIRMYGYGNKSTELAKKEADKCVLLCANCHRDFHHLERENNIKIEEYIG